MSARSVKGEIAFRSYALRSDTLNTETRTVRLRISSEAPVMRTFRDATTGEPFMAREVLVHTAECLNLNRVNDGTAVLLEHDPKLRVGITESGNIMADKSAEAVIRFAKTPLGDSAMGEVKDGTLRWVSIGYEVRKLVMDECDPEEDDDCEDRTVRAVAWEILETSLVGIPADTSARVLRTGNETGRTITIENHMKQNLNLEAQPAGGGGGGNVAPAIITEKDFSRDLNEAKEILSTAAHYQRSHPAVLELAEKAIKDNMGLARFHKQVCEIVATPAIPELSAPRIEGVPQRARQGRSVGELLINSESFRAAMKSGNKQALRNLSLHIADVFQFRDLGEMQTRATFSGATEGTAGTSGMNIQTIQGMSGLLNQQPLFVADLFGQGSTNGDTIRFLIEDAYTQAATVVTEGAAKPAATLNVSVANATVYKIAVTVKVTDEMMNDAQQIMSYANGRLGYMVQAKEEDNLLNGNTTNQKGVLNQTGIQNVTGAGGAIEAVATAIEYVRGANGAGFSVPDAIIMNPLDWLSFKLSKDDNGQYLFGGPNSGPYGVGGYSNVSTCWGLPLVATTAIARGTALVGAFRTAAQIFRRQGLTIESTNSNSDDFENNLISLRAECRLALAVYQPNRFCTVTAIPA